MKYTKLIPFHRGEITASGWLREQLLRNKDGIGGHLDELEPLMIHTPYTEQRTEQNWGGPGWGAEISGNYWYGFICLAFALQDEELIAKATAWVDAVLANQEEDGYMGAYAVTDNRREDYNAWGTACGMRAMLAYYDATGREEVFTAVYRCMLWFCDNWADHKTPYAGHAITEPMLECYAKTGDKRLLDFALAYDAFMEADNTYLSSTSYMLSDKWQYNANHTVAYGICLRRLLNLYGATNDPRYLAAAENGLRKLREKSMHLTGAPVGNDEWLSPVGMVNESETCNFAMYQYDYVLYEQLTGNSIYGEYREQLVFNAAEGARKKDERAIAYMTMPNQFECSENATRSHIWATMYAPCVPTSCCPVYSVHVIPDYVNSLLLHDAADDLYIHAYGPCQLRSGSFQLDIDTLYPFSEQVQITIHKAPDTPKTIHFHVPSWCTAPTISCNGEAVSTCSIERQWQAGDKITLTFPMTPQIVQIDDTDAGNKQPLAVQCGPLVYSLPLSEAWQAIGNGYARTPLPENWTWYNVIPTEPLQKNTAMDFPTAQATAKVEFLPENGYVWEKPPVRVTLDLYKAPYAYCGWFVHSAKEPAGQVQSVTERYTATLVPYGCTALRITYFPKADPADVQRLR